MKKIVSFIFACTYIITAQAATCLPGNRPGALTLTLGAGYFYPDSKRHMENKATGMIAASYDFTSHWGIEGMLTAFRTHFKTSIHDPSSISGTLFMVDGVYHFLPEQAFQPYILAGVGILGLSPNLYDANNSGNINAALGAQFFINQYFSLRLEARDLYTWVGGKNDVFLNAGISVSFDLC